MATNFPTSEDPIVSHVTGQVIQAADVNNPEAAIFAMEHMLVGPTFINVKSQVYAGGAKGDGSTDDTPALQAALNALASSGGTLIFPSGSYKTTADLTFTAVANTTYTLWGTGFSRILATQADGGSESGAITLNGLSTARLTIRGLRIDRSPAGTTTGTKDGILIQPITSGTANFAGVTLEDVTSIGFTLWGISIVNATNVVVRNCTSNSHKNGGLEFVGGADVAVVGGDYSSNVSSTGGSDYGIAFASSATYGACDGFLVTGVRANNNGRKGIDVHHGRDGVIIGNTCIGNGANGSASTASGIYAVNEDSTKAARDVTISDNHIDMTGNVVNGAHGIEVGAAGGSAVESGTFIVTGNTIRGCDAHASDGGIFVYNPSAGVAVSKVVISKNTMENAAGTAASAILTQNNAVNTHLVEIEGNLIHLNGAVTGGITAQLCDRLVITGNILQFDGASTNGIFASNGQAIVVGNQLLGTAPGTAFNTASAASAIVNGNYLGASATLAPLVVALAAQNGIKVITGSVILTILNGTRSLTGTAVAFGFTFASAPLVYLALENRSALTAAESPAVPSADTITATGFNADIDAQANVAANRALTVAWVAIGA